MKRWSNTIEHAIKQYLDNVLAGSSGLSYMKGVVSTAKWKYRNKVYSVMDSRCRLM